MSIKKGIKTSLSLLLATIIVFSGLFNFGTLAATDNIDSQKTWKTAKELIAEQGFLSGIQMFEASERSSGNDIGDGGIWGSEENFQPEVWKQFFVNSKAMGFQICKMWNNYQMGGIVFDKEYRVVGPSDTYLENLETIFKMAAEYDLYICLTLMTHFESSFSAEETQYNYDKLIRIVHNEEHRNLFINRGRKN